MNKLQSVTTLATSIIYLSTATAANAVICNPVLKNCTSSTAPKTYINNVLSAFTLISSKGSLPDAEICLHAK